MAGQAPDPSVAGLRRLSGVFGGGGRSPGRPALPAALARLAASTARMPACCLDRPCAALPAALARLAASTARMPACCLDRPCAALPAALARLAALVALSVGGGAALAQNGADRVVTPAVGIRTPPIHAPAEMAGTGIDPEVAVKVDIDETGAVSRVHIQTIEPSSQFDELLRSRVTEALKRWRFGPARDGEDNPAPSTMSWRMKFVSQEEGSRPGASAFAIDNDLRVLAGSDALPMNFRPLTRQERAERLSGIVEKAEKHLDRTHRRRRETQRFIVVSDAEEESTAEILAGNMESIFQVFHSIFDQHLEPMPQNWKLVVYLYRRQSSLEQLNRGIGGRDFGAGFYQSPGLLAFHQEVHYYDQLLSTMVHEAFHAFSDSHLTAPGKNLPRWAEEGLAEYFSNSKIEDGQLVPGELNRGRYAIAHGRKGPQRLQSQSAWSVREARQALRQGEAPSIAELIETGADTFYGDRHQVFYGFSWLFTHFLWHGRDSWESGEPFARLLLYLTEEYPSRDALEAVYGSQPEALQDEFEDYVRRF